MRLKRTFLTSVVAAALAAALSAVPAAADGKPDAKRGDAAAVAADVAAGKSSVAASPEVASASVAIQSRIEAYVRAHGTKYTFGAYADALTNKVVVETDAPAEVVSSLVGTNVNASMVEVRKQALTDDFSRRDDVPSFWGGSGITFAAPNGHCSSGYTVQNSVGTRFLVTAGHCFANGATAVTELGGRVVGVASGNGLPSQDMVLLGGQSYSPFIFVGGVDSSTGHHVASAANPIVGFNNYCHSGRTTGEHCGHTVSSITGTVCTSSGCKSPVIVYSGGTLPQGGDSGAPFYALSVSANDKHIRGHHIASGGNTRYAEMWSRVQARFGVSIVT